MNRLRFAFFLFAAASGAPAAHFDVLVRGGRVLDGSGTPWFYADVALNGDRIAAVGQLPAGATAKQRMARKLTTITGRQAYSRRKTIVEPVFGQMATLQNAKQLRLRGLDQARGEWLLLAACHNLRKLHGHIGITGLAALPAG